MKSTVLNLTIYVSEEENIILIHKSFWKLNLLVGMPGKEKPEMISD